MKKTLVNIGLILAAGWAFSADVEEVLGNRRDRIISELQDNHNHLANGGTLTNGLTVTGTTTINGTLAASGSSLTANNLTVRTNVIVNGSETVVGNSTVTGTVAAVAGMTAKSRAVVTAPSTAYYMLESGTKAASGHDGATTITQAFTTVFTTAPVVLWNYSGSPTSESPKVATVATNQFILQAQTNITWIAIGLKSN